MTNTTARPGEARETFERLVLVESNDCVLWPHALKSDGYGVLHNPGGSDRVNVQACERRHGPAPAGREAAHSCGVRACMNPRHLRWATSRENHQEAVGHGTAAPGYNRKLTPAEEATIRAMWPGVRQTEIAAWFGVHVRTVRNILRR